MRLPKVNQISIKDALKRQKSKFQWGIWNAHNLKGKTFHELNKLAESVLKGNFDGLRELINITTGSARYVLYFNEAWSAQRPQLFTVFVQ